MWWWLLALGALIVVVVVLFNRLVSLRTRAAAAWSDIDVQLKRRYDLVGNLVDTVKQLRPDLVVARAFGLTEREFFGLDDPTEARVPKTGL